MDCPRNSNTHWPHGPATEPHDCPYALEIGDEHKLPPEERTKCQCCDRCTQECADDI